MSGYESMSKLVEPMTELTLTIRPEFRRGKNPPGEQGSCRRHGPTCGRGPSRAVAFAFVLLPFVLLLGLTPVPFAGIARGDEDGGWPRYNPAHRRDNGTMMRLIRPLTRPIESSVVQVHSDGKPVALATVVSEDGYCLTKRSELSGDPIRVRLPDDRLFPARVAAVDRENDLALLHIDADDVELTPVELTEMTPPVGGFLISAGHRGRPIGIGVVGVRPRPIAHTGRLGVILAGSDTGGALVRGVFPGSGAEQAGIRQQDRIVAINGKQQSDRATVMSTLHEMYPGEVVRLTIEREGGELAVDAEMRDMSLLQESPNDARVNGRRNERLSGFEEAIQHDTVLAPEECGGPLLDSAGRVIGINIARAGRIVSYALPASVIRAELVGLLDEARATSR